MNPNSNRGSSFGKKRKPWHVEGLIKDLNKAMKKHIGEWLDAFFKGVAPITVYPHLINRESIGLTWMAEEGYHWDHKEIKHISDTSFAMVFVLYKGVDKQVSTFDFVVNHDGSFKDPHYIAAMIFTGEVAKNL